MTHKQYSDMTIIMEFCRIFADQMHKCMENAGLVKQGFRLHIEVGDVETGDGTQKCYVGLEQNFLDTPEEEYIKNRMHQVRNNAEGWKVLNDPISDTGAVPSVVRSIKKEAGEPQERKATGTETPSDGLWISAYDDYLPVDGGM